MLVDGNGLNISIWEYEAPHPAPSDDQLLVLWRTVDEIGSKNILSLPTIVERESEFLRREYLKWVDELSTVTINGESVVKNFMIRENLSSWWLTLIDQKCNYLQSPHITDMIKLFALNSFILTQNKLAKLHLFSSNINIIKTLDKWSNEHAVNFSVFKNQNLTARSKVSVTCGMCSLINATSWIFYNFYKRSRLKKVNAQDYCRGENNVIFFSYLPADLTKSVRADNFWGPLLGDLKRDDINIRIVFMYSGPFRAEDCEKINSYIARANHDLMGNICVSLSSFFTFDVFIGSIKDWLKTWRCAGSALTGGVTPLLGGMDVATFLTGDWYESFRGRPSMQNALDLNLLEKLLKGYDGKTLGFYLAEGQAWEMSLVATWKRLGLGRITGYAHSTIRFWDLRYFHFDKNRLFHGPLARPKCDRLLVNGKLSLGNYFSSECDSLPLVECEALRYLYLNKIKESDFSEEANYRDFSLSFSNLSSSNSKITPLQVGDFSQLKRILVILDYSIHHSERLLEVLRSYKIKEMKGLIFSVRMHPDASFDVTLPDWVVLSDRNIPLTDALSLHDMVICSSVSSASVECYIFKESLLVYFDPAALMMTSVRGLPGVVYFSTPDGLYRLLADQTPTPPRRVCVGELLNLDVQLPLWRSALLADGVKFNECELAPVSCAV